MMQNKKLALLVGGLVLFISAAAFIGGKLLNQRMDPVAPDAPFRGDFRSMILPAPELPATLPDVTGSFVERQDNMIVIETKSLETSSVVSVSPANTRRQSGPRVEVVITGKTLTFRETTHPSEPLSAENQTIQQTVEQATLEDLDSQSMLMVWGRKNGDRIIAEVLMYSDLVNIKSAIFEDCEICP
jgi:hypothetical protein